MCLIACLFDPFVLSPFRGLYLIVYFAYLLSKLNWAKVLLLVICSKVGKSPEFCEFIKFVVQAGKSPVLLNLVKLIKLFKAGKVLRL